MNAESFIYRWIKDYERYLYKQDMQPEDIASELRPMFAIWDALPQPVQQSLSVYFARKFGQDNDFGMFVEDILQAAHFMHHQEEWTP